MDCGCIIRHIAAVNSRYAPANSSSSVIDRSPGSTRAKTSGRPLLKESAHSRVPRSGKGVVEIAGGVAMDEEAFRAFQHVPPRYNAIQIDEDLHLVESPEVTLRRGGGSLNHSK